MRFVRLITLSLALALLGGALKVSLPAQTGTRTPRPDSKAAETADLIDINHAGIGELRKLPGIGDAYATAIIRHRPYRNKTQLRSSGVIPEAVYKKIRDKIIAKQ